jgi:hypothetical protein
VLDKIVYTLTNPVKDGLVRDYRKWPGLNTRPGDWRRGTRSARRPTVYFTKTPAELSYTICAPAQLGDSVEQAIATIELHIRMAQERAAAELAAQGRSVMGANAVRATNPLEAPNTQRPLSKINPSLAAGGDSQALAAGKLALKLFRLAYRAAWEQFKSSASATFPGGTLLMRTRFRQACTPLDVCWCVTTS